MTIEHIRAPIADDLQAVNALIRHQLHSDVAVSYTHLDVYKRQDSGSTV